jgi:hypothetical protein
MTEIVLLGPQRLKPTVGRIVHELGLEGPVAAITGGWEEREHEDQELTEQLDLETFNLELYRRGEQVLEDDPALADALQDLRAQRRTAQALYRISLNGAVATLRALAEATPSEYSDEELAAAFDVVRSLDSRHLERVTRIEASFRRRWATARRHAVRRQRGEIEEILERCPVVAIAGGHVGVLTDLMRFFGLDSRLKHHHLLAWSAGAMALGSRVVLFHDSPPQGFGNAEVWGPGLGLYGRLLPFPQARKRLRLDDSLRATILARRFAPQMCVPLDEREHVVLVDGQVGAGSRGRRLEQDGRVAELAG